MTLEMKLTENQINNITGLMRLTYSRFLNAPPSTEKERLAFEYMAISEYLDNHGVRLNTTYGVNYENVYLYVVRHK